MHFPINKKYVVISNDLCVFALAILNSIIVSRYYGLDFLGLSVYYFVFVGPLISLARFSIDKKILVLLNDKHKPTLHRLAYWSSFGILGVGFLIAMIIGNNNTEKLFLIFMLLLRLAQVNLKYLVNFQISVEGYKRVARLNILIYGLPFILLLVCLYAGVEVKSLYFVYIAYLVIIVILLFHIEVPYGNLKRGINMSEHISLTAADFLITLKTSIPRYFFDILFGREILGLIAICQQIAQLSDILPGSLIKVSSGDAKRLARRSPLIGLEHLRNKIFGQVVAFLFILYLVICLLSENIFKIIYAIDQYPSIVLLLLLLIARGISNLISVDKYILNLFNSTSNILLGMILNVLFLILYYSLMLVLGVNEIFILLLPILLSEIGLLYTYRQKANMALR
jgi:O-antigen/teichoic acid export membrane protein